MMKKIAILAAMSKELDQLKTLFSEIKEKNVSGLRCFEGKIGDKLVILSESGMGKVCAATNITEVIRSFKPDLIINSGCAGSLAKEIDVKDVVVGNEISYHDVWFWKPNQYGQVQGFPARFTADENALKKIKKITKSDSKVHFGLICTGDKFISHPDEIKQIKEHFPESCAVDMEAAAMAQVCYMYNTPLISIKVISDNPVKYPNGYKQYNEFWSELADESFSFVKDLLQVI